MRDPRTILITGASSGIGEALAVEYAKHDVFLALSGRDPARLEEVRVRCRNRGAMFDARVIDVTDAEAMAAWIAEIEAKRPLDLVIANAGVSAGTGGGRERPDQVRNVLAINVDGVMNTVLPAIEAMLAREPAQADAKPTTKRGQIAIMSSLASFRGLPGAPAYCASKAAVRSYGEAMRGELHHRGIEVNVICPGYIRSRMTERNKFPMPMLMDAERAARKIKRGLRRNRGRIAFPLTMYVLIRLIAALPVALIDPMLRVLPKKAAAGK
jgi:short-subunit dehydrogenase